MADYNKMLIDLLNEKTAMLNHERAVQKREINKLKKEIKRLNNIIHFMELEQEKSKGAKANEE